MSDRVESLTPEEMPQALRQAYGDLDGLYRERAQLLAWLAALHPGSVLAPAPDIEDGTSRWQILFIKTSPGGWQLTWHIAPSDVALFTGVENVQADDHRAIWDGHTTAQKYRRIRTHVSILAKGLLPAVASCLRRRCLAPDCGPKCGHRVGGR